MPTYEYRCRDCGHSFDIVQKMSDDPLTHCPECGGPLRKVFTAPAISFKGSGFYATDQRSKGTGGSSGAPAAEKKDAGASEGKKSDTKKSEGSSSSDSTSDPSSSGSTKKEGSS